MQANGKSGSRNKIRSAQVRNGQRLCCLADFADPHQRGWICLERQQRMRIAPALNAREVIWAYDGSLGWIVRGEGP